tara:strand:- start:1860 stop:2042 length:183 start_codon:yes stop_codon:yes gene_type:complete
MIIGKISKISGEMKFMNLDITPDQIESYNNGLIIQHALPNLNHEEREFFKTGTIIREEIT